MLQKILSSTNGQNQVILLVLFAVGAIYGIGEQAIEGLFIAGASVVMWVTEIRKGDRPGKFGLNSIAYLLAAGVAAFPALGSIFEAVEPVAEYLFSGEKFSLGTLVGLAIPLFTEIAFFVSRRNEEQNE